jgi:di/tricarboxylate transporter
VQVSDSTTALLILAAVIALFAWNRLPVGLVAVGAALSLWATDLLTLEQAFAGFGDPVIVFIATLFVVSEGIDSTGVTSWLGERIAATGGSPARLLVALMLLCAGLTALISLNGSAAALLPMVVALAVRLGRSPGRLLMPMVYAGSAGSMLVLMGSPVNVIASDASTDAGGGGFAFFEFAWIGVPLVAVTVLLGVLLTPRLLPDRVPANVPPDLSGHAETLAEYYGLPSAHGLVTADRGVAEVVVPPRSPLVGERIRPGAERRDELVILAVSRYGRDHGPDEVEIAAGDALLVTGPWRSIDTLADDRDVLVVGSTDQLRRQTAPLGPKAKVATAILLGMVVLLGFDLVPPAVAGLLAAAAMLLTRVVSSRQAYEAVSWQTIVLVGGLIPLSVAIRSSGAAEVISDRVIDVVGSGSPTVLLVALFVLTCVLGLVISNTATVLIALPIALATAAETGISVQPVLMLIVVASSAALLTPVQTPANMMIMTPGGYRFGDYWRLGLPITVAWLAVSLLVIPRVWPY